MQPISTATAEHYTWGQACDGWLLAPSPAMLVIEERMPPGTRETRHHHAHARQFFYVLAGELTMVLDDAVHRLPASTGIEIAPGCRHEARNESPADVRFLVVSSPSTRGDRIES